MPPQDTRNVMLNTAGETLFGFKSSLVASATVLTVLLRRYGASERMIGGIVSVETVCYLLPQILGIYIFASRRQLKRRLILWHVLVMLPFILFMGLLSFRADDMNPALYRWGMLGCWAGFCFAVGMALAAWVDFMAHLFRSEIRGTVMGLAGFGAALGGTGAGLLAGWMISVLPSPQVFAWIYLGAWAVGTLTMGFWVPVEDWGAREAEDAPPPPFLALVGSFRDSLRDANYRSFLIGRVIAGFGFCILPFIALYYQSEAGGALSTSRVVSCGAAMTLGSAFGALLSGRIGDRFGHRAGMIFCSAMQIVTLLALFAGAGVWGCVLSYGCAGLAISGGVSHNNLILETCRHGQRMAHIVVSNLILGVTMGLAPLVGGAVAEFAGLRWFFGLSLVVSVLALGWFGFLFKEPRVLKAQPGQA